MTTPFEQLGGEPALRRLVDAFVDRAFDDLMIGFLFRNADRARVKAKEYELAARNLGADVAYTGRPLPEAHGPHPIMGGHFDRRLKILEEVFEELDVPQAVRERWLEHDRRLRAAITGDAAGKCDGEAALRRVRQRGRPLPRGEG